MGPFVVVGVDPGPVTGLAVIGPHTRHEVAQCSPGAVVALIGALVGELPEDVPVLIAVERFVVGPRAARSATPTAGRIARGVVEDVARAFKPCSAPTGTRVIERSAVDVKPWATDLRLAAAGLLDPTKGMPHARDACRHALYAAVRDGGLPDPLSRSSKVNA